MAPSAPRLEKIASPYQIERSRRRSLADLDARAGDTVLLRFDSHIVGDADVDETDGLRFGTASGPRDSRYGDTDRRTRPLLDAASHRLGDLLAHRAVPRKHGLGNTELARLGSVRIGHSAFEKVVGASGYVGEPLRDETTRAALGGGDRVSLHVEPDSDDL